jgi:hypothetical protein
MLIYKARRRCPETFSLSKVKSRCSEWSSWIRGMCSTCHWALKTRAVNMSSSRTTTSISDVDVAKTQLHKHDLQAKQHLRTLAWLTLGSRACVWFLMAAAAHLPLFDSSPLVLMPSSNRVLASGMRWDMFYFAAIARNGYQYEQQWAFLPGPALVMRLGAKGLQFVKSDPNSIVSWDDLLLGGIAFVLSMSTTRTMYKLSLHHLRWHQLAFLASCLSLLPSSPVTLYVAPYSEPFFTYLSYHGNLWLVRRFSSSHHDS